MIAKFNEIEIQRLNLQEKLDQGKTLLERNKMGQFATPKDLARQILAYTLTLLPTEAPIRFLDPAIGTGSFYSALLASASTNMVEDAVGFEIDPHYGRPAEEFWTGTPLRIVHGDFTTAPPPPIETQSNLVVCNPPYVRHHHLDKDQKVRLQLESQKRSGIKGSGLAGLYTYFLTLSHAWMTEGGIAAWLIPSEFMDVNYGKAVKEYLLKKVSLLRIHRFDPNDVQFGDALVSSAIVWFKKCPPNKENAVEFTFGGQLGNPKVTKLVLTTELLNEAKWTRFPCSEVRESTSGPRLKDYFKIQRGLATGDNKFFIMTAEDAAAKGLPEKFLRPILPSPRTLPSDEILADANGIPVIPQPLLLLDCRLSEKEIQAGYPELWDYLQSGTSSVAKGYLCSHRSPWYSQEDRPASPFMCTYMGRSDNKDNAPPFRFLLNHSRATAANVYLMLYPRQELKEALEQKPWLLNEIWNILKRIKPTDLLDEGRVYGGGLHKMEPKELANVRADQIASLINIEKDSLDAANKPNKMPPTKNKQSKMTSPILPGLFEDI